MAYPADGSIPVWAEERVFVAVVDLELFHDVCTRRRAWAARRGWVVENHFSCFLHDVR